MTNDPNQTAYRHLIITTVVYSILMFLGLGALVGNSRPAAPIAFATIGLAGASAHLSAVWATLGPGPYWKRMLIAGTAVSCVLAAALVAIGAGAGTELLPIVIPLPFCWVVAQIPYCLLRLLFGWKIDLEANAEHGRVSILDVMVYTALVAITIGMVNFLEAAWSVSSIGGRADGKIDLSPILFGAAILSVVGLIYCVPAIMLILSRREPPTGCGLYAVYSLVSTVVWFPILTIFAGLPPAGAVEGLTYLFVMIASFGFFFGMPLTVSRQSGFILTSKRRLKNWPEPDT